MTRYLSTRGDSLEHLSKALQGWRPSASLPRRTAVGFLQSISDTFTASSLRCVTAICDDGSGKGRLQRHHGHERCIWYIQKASHAAMKLIGTKGIGLPGHLRYWRHTWYPASFACWRHSRVLRHFTMSSHLSAPVRKRRRPSEDFQRREESRCRSDASDSSAETSLAKV